MNINCISRLTLISLSYLAVSCTSFEEKNEYELEESGVFKTFPLSDRTPPFSDCAYQEVVDGNDLYFYMGINNEIVVYDLNTEKEVKRITLETVGPNGIGDLRAFTPGKDSTLFVVGLNTYELSQVDFDGKVINRFSFLNAGNHHPIAGNSFPKNVSGGPLYFENGFISFPTLPQGMWSQLNEDFLKTYQVEALINLEDKSIYFLPITYPEDYYNEGDYHVHYQRIKNKGSYIYSFSTDPRIYKYEEGGSISIFNAESKYMESTMNKYLTGGVEEYLKSVIELPRFRHIIYDEYREVFYRFAYLGDKLSNRVEVTGTLQEQIKYLSNLSIIILDKNLKKIGETKLTYGKYLPGNYFITEEGLYISTNNPTNPAMSEDYMKFELLRLVEDI